MKKPTQYQQNLEDALISYSDIINSVSEAICIVNSEGMFLEVNKGAGRMYGYTREEMIGMSTAVINAPNHNDLDHTMTRLQHVLKTGETAEFESWGLRKDGNVFPKDVIYNRGQYQGQTVVLATARDITEKKRVSIELQDAKERLRLIVDNTLDVVVTIDQTGCFCFVNESVKRVLGYETSDLIGQPFHHFVPETSVALMSAKLQEAHADGQVHDFESQVLSKDGRVIDVQVAGKAIHYENSDVIQSTLHDITARKQAERDVEYQLALRKLLMELSSDFINVPLNQSEHVINNSLAKVCEFVGADRSYVFDYNLKCQTLTNTYEYCREGIEPQIDNLKDVPIEMFSRWYKMHIKGKIVEIPDVRALPMGPERDVLEQQDILSLIAVPMTSNDECIGFIGFDSVKEHNRYSDDEKQMIHMFSRNLVNMKQRIASEESAAKLSMAIEQNPTSILITDKEGSIEYANPAAIKMTGYQLQELIGKNPKLFKSGEHNNALYQTLWSTLLDGKTWQGELLNKKKNGELVWENTTISPIIKNCGEITHFVAIKEDITSKKKMIAELEQAKERAEQSDQLKSAFLANMSHEIRTPLNGILGFSSLLEEEDESFETVKEYAEIISNSGSHLLNLINDIIHISKIDAGHIKAVAEAINLTALLNELYEVFRGQIENSSHALKLELVQPSDPLWILTDPTRLRQILENLLGNALKFTRSGSIQFGFQEREDKLLFHVKDTGIGIHEDQHTSVFERFTQASHETERLYGGTGLGLSISKSCAQMLGGDIWLESVLGTGSVFYFDIDYVPHQKMKIEKTGEPDKEPQFTGEHILIAEDDDLSYLFLKKVLSMKNLKVSRTTSGIETIERVMAADDIDFLLMDIQMPGMNGWEATRQIKKIKPNLPIVAQTAYAFENDREKCIEAGCDAYISKPIQPKQLLSLIASHL
ncbi:MULTISPECIES: PAS domain S-box protein [unclassified Lentimonas]|uniref:PAS domain S-box protein n=1 Tax=unclassified Lentimonas TaxID=2630993 RepID=UPI00132531B6|nr:MULTISPECIES: PAS domain S-box protein [unclassified Lentimonas]CAA6692070.1 Unannotated [Lentimonas sp. CC10]CAA6693971.1 Unannotated [Lentimonas sp. CC19]CAA7070246.1 Unannotated [Lentimonas sp. CC11]